MIVRGAPDAGPWRWAWWIPFAAIALNVAYRMQAFSLAVTVSTAAGARSLPNTFATVDHPFHVARAGVLWRELQAGQLLRWFSQHQGGYPVEFYPLGESWLEVVIRAVSLGSLSAEGAHTLAVVFLFLAPGAAFAALAREDGWSPAVALFAFALHVALPGGWYGGGYTELVQWGLVTNVAGAVAAFAMLPSLLRFLVLGRGWAAALTSALAAVAVYANPRSLVGLAALGIGAVAAVLWSSPAVPPRLVLLRLVRVAAVAALLAAPELMPLARFGNLYAFVHYSAYDQARDYFASAVSALNEPVLALGAAGLALGVLVRSRLATTAAAASLLVYAGMTVLVAFVPLVASLAAQLEPTRLMPLQRLLTIYLAASAVGAGCAWLGRRIESRRRWVLDGALAVVAVGLLLFLTRTVAGPPPDPASPAVSPVGLYPVAMSASREQAALHDAVLAADEAAEPGTAILILGSALSWHQPLWAPLWTTRPLYYDNWLWYWRPDHTGTPGYAFAAGNAYPDPERTLDADYLSRHGIGAVLVTGPVRSFARSAPTLRPLTRGVYDSYLVAEPATTVTFGGQPATHSEFDNHHVSAEAAVPAAPVVARVNWHPRWAATLDGQPVDLIRRDDGYMEVAGGTSGRHLQLDYRVQPLDWVARGLALLGLTWLLALAIRPMAGGWYPAKRGPRSGRS